MLGLSSLMKIVSLLQGKQHCPLLGLSSSRLVGLSSSRKTYVIDENTSHTPEVGAHSPSWSNGLIIVIIIISISIIIIIIIIIVITEMF